MSNNKYGDDDYINLNNDIGNWEYNLSSHHFRNPKPWDNLSVNSNKIEIASITPTHTVQMTDDMTIKIGDDFVIEAGQLKACLKVLLDLAKEKYPEDLI